MKKAQTVISVCVGLLISLAWGSQALAFDDDFSINSRIFKPENYLDLQAIALRPSLRRQWWDVENGVLISGASLDSHRLALNSEIRLKQALSSRLDVRLHWAEDSFYKIVPSQRPQFELVYRAIGLKSDWPLAVSLLGSPAYDKRQSDLGAAVTLGSRPRDFLRIEYLSQDHFYNQKNVFDESSYERTPQVYRILGDYQLTTALRARFSWGRSRRLEFVDTTEGLNFQHASKEVSAYLDYQLDGQAWLGLGYRGLTVKKSRQDLSDNQQQRVGYEYLDLYYSYHKSAQREWLLGTRFDLFENDLDDLAAASLSQDYRFSTWQLYTTYLIQYAPNKAIDLGLYVGDVRERMLLGEPGQQAWNDRLVESKLRVGWELISSDQASRLMIYFSVNLDDVINDPGDGGGMRYVAQF